MSAFGLMPVSSRTLGVAVLLALVAGGPAMLAWQVQTWRYERQLAQTAQIQAQMLNQITQEAAIQQKAEQDKRLALEQQLSASEQSHYRALSDAQRDQDRLRDRLATADVRLSVLLDADDVAAGCAVPATAGTGGVDHGPLRARLDPAHAQRIVAITDEGDRGLIALQACQAYVRALGR
ncbi:lysis system i-spanin subunit Rz [Pseudomonas fluorescens]|uniref:Lysis protein n=1 Tax=Pseudomonas fluorescens TaxID=294 RepID=A0A944DRP0_PSEFL|nr:lysis system i-spanin subunit Rz [Pseudomonas fluorescens]MBT2295491.1 lysis protein [Pseudomonas fluorescens]MBT2308829.1 lysis protein [Pseudomonas fluorescens]MBT2312418.1 lysis protein [Pseudomonas fluorescens]MBT2318015.1 lysis protein [Pseudomonas fluorescens]MBT2330905.1 lysis protein [Pseudomonas fluorescens]